MVDEEHAVKVIHLVLDADGVETFGLFLHLGKWLNHSM